MDNSSLYEDIKTRTNGDIYVGVVGPVRTGKSTFIKKFMDLLVIPNIDNEYKKQRAQDELPQSASGRTIMTTEPKFVPNEAVEITVDKNIKLKTRLVDCVGYLIDNAIGHMEGDMPRMIKTPWQEDEIPFEEAAEIGTRKVIEDHSSIGIVVTTDGSITDIPREDYLKSEERVIRELKEINKPFVILLNSRHPFLEDTIRLADNLSQKYNATVLPVNCEELQISDINNIFAKLLFEFPINQVNIRFSNWVDGLNNDYPLKQELYSSIRESFGDISLLREANDSISQLNTSPLLQNCYIDRIDLGQGVVSVFLDVDNNLFYDVLTKLTGIEIKSESDLFSIITSLSSIKKKYDKIAYALQEVEAKGYGIVTPSIEELILEEPEMVKQGSRFGVRLKATAPSLHLIRANIQTEVSPIVGSEKQSEELVNYLLSEFESDPLKIWESNIFGKSLHELVNEGLQTKLAKMPEDAQVRLQETLERIVNEGSGGLICIIL